MTLESQNLGNPAGLDLDKEEDLWGAILPGGFPKPIGEKEELAKRTEEEVSF